ncbi:MAG TPA: hypothetical protein VE441_09640 [Mycobacterium sp.]|nr:hypothetical protein [Mycobacterium sp.]
MAERTDWRHDLETELRALGRELAVPTATDLTEAVRDRLDGSDVRSAPPSAAGIRMLRLPRPAWRVAIAIVLVLLGLLVTTPQGRALVTHVFRFSGIELSQQSSPVVSPRPSPSLPGEQRVPLEQAGRLVAFPILVPAALGRPAEVVVSDHGRVATLVYHHTAYGQVRMDEFNGHLDTVIFEKFVYGHQVSQVRLNGRNAYWVKGPYEIVYIAVGGRTDTASARLTEGNTLIWDTRRVALRLEGRFDRPQALAIASSAR